MAPCVAISMRDFVNNDFRFSCACTFFSFFLLFFFFCSFVLLSVCLILLCPRYNNNFSLLNFFDLVSGIVTVMKSAEGSVFRIVLLVSR